MIARLTGILASKEPDQLIVDVHGVGYSVIAPLSTFYALPEQGAEVRLTIHSHVTADSIQLFGFATTAELIMFRLLLGVSRIGPKLAGAILSGMETDQLIRALAQGDIARLVTIPGVGKKAAERMVVDLKDKAAGMCLPGAAVEQPVAAGGDEQLVCDAVSALTNLGYKPAQADKSVRAALEGLADEDPSLERLLKRALIGLAR